MATKQSAVCKNEHDHPAKKTALHRIRIIEGHMKCLEHMLSRGEYCLDIVHQSRAIQKALKKLDMVLIKDHLDNCVVDQVKNGDTKRTTEELLRLYEFK